MLKIHAILSFKILSHCQLLAFIIPIPTCEALTRRSLKAFWRCHEKISAYDRSDANGKHHKKPSQVRAKEDWIQGQWRQCRLRSGGEAGTAFVSLMGRDHCERCIVALLGTAIGVIFCATPLLLNDIYILTLLFSIFHPNQALSKNEALRPYRPRHPHLRRGLRSRQPGPTKVCRHECRDGWPKGLPRSCRRIHPRGRSIGCQCRYHGTRERQRSHRSVRIINDCLWSTSTFLLSCATFYHEHFFLTKYCVFPLFTFYIHHHVATATTPPICIQSIAGKLDHPPPPPKPHAMPVTPMPALKWPLPTHPLSVWLSRGRVPWLVWISMLPTLKRIRRLTLDFTRSHKLVFFVYYRGWFFVLYLVMACVVWSRWWSAVGFLEEANTEWHWWCHIMVVVDVGSSVIFDFTDTPAIPFSLYWNM